ncbi:MAG: hypothetical protein M3033_10630 [Acidobacteriota bacterium]|nr:hypothetical protein [Acidobacteriota bacterium]
MVNDEADFQTSEIFARDCHKELLTVLKFAITKVNPLWEIIILKSDRDVSINGLYLRAIAWMHGLRKLNEGVDVQPVISGARSFLEITTDLILVYYDKTNESGWRMRCWDASAKLKSAKALIEFFNNRIKQPIPKEYIDYVNFVNNNEADIKRQRIILGWVKLNDPTQDIHPKRWSNRSELLQDVIEADKFHGLIVERHFGSTLETFYETEYRNMNWNVHGSGLTGVRNVDRSGINFIRAFGYNWSAKLAMVCSDIMLRELKDKGVTGDIDNIVSEAEYISVNLS